MASRWRAKASLLGSPHMADWSPALLHLTALALDRLFVRSLHELLKQHRPRVDVEELTLGRRLRRRRFGRRTPIRSVSCSHPIGLLRCHCIYLHGLDGRHAARAAAYPPRASAP